MKRMWIVALLLFVLAGIMPVEAFASEAPPGTKLKVEDSSGPHNGSFKADPNEWSVDAGRLPATQPAPDDYWWETGDVARDGDWIGRFPFFEEFIDYVLGVWFGKR